MPWYSIPEAARDIFEVSASTLRKWVMEEGCPSGIAPDGVRVVNPKAVELWLADAEAEDEEEDLEESSDEFYACTNADCPDPECDDADCTAGQDEDDDEDASDED